MRTRLAQIIEERQGFGTRELFFLDARPAFPLRRRNARCFQTGVRKNERDMNPCVIDPHDVRLKAGGTRLSHADGFQIDHGGGHLHFLITKTGTRRRQFPADGDEGTAIVNGPAGLVAQEIGINVTGPESPRTFQGEALAHLQFAKGKMARARIQNEVHAFQGQRRSGPVGHPGVFADFKTDAHIAATERKIADGIMASLNERLAAHARRPWLEPAWFVMNAITREKPFGHEPHNLPVNHQTGAIEQAVLMQNGQPERDHHATCGGDRRLQGLPGHAGGIGGMERVFASIASQTQFRQAQKRHALLARLVDGGQNAPGIALPIQGRLIQNRRADFNQFHNPGTIRHRSDSGTTCSLSRQNTGRRDVDKGQR